MPPAAAGRIAQLAGAAAAEQLVNWPGVVAPGHGRTVVIRELGVAAEARRVLEKLAQGVGLVLR